MPLPNHPNHDHYWISGCVLYESYRTCRGLEYLPVAQVIYPDRDYLNAEEIEVINEMLNVNKEG